MPGKKLPSSDKKRILDEVFVDGNNVSNVCNKRGISRFTFYNWAKKAKDGKDKVGSYNLDALIPNYRRGANHHKSRGWQVYQNVLECVVRHPNYSAYKISKYLDSYCAGKYKVSSHAIYKYLLSKGLNTKEKRQEFAAKHVSKTVIALKFSDFERYKLVEKILHGETISNVSRKYHVSRQALHSWINKYQEEKTVSSLSHKRRNGDNHWRSIAASAKELVFAAVAANPEHSVHKLHISLEGAVGHHGIQNLLERESLNTLEKRLDFAKTYEFVPPQEKITSQEAPVPKLSLWRLLYAPYATIPKWFLKRPITWPVVLPLLIFFLYIFEVDILFRPAYFFPIVALSFGMFFFLYSLKYYFSLVVVLWLSQSGRGDIDEEKDNSAVGGIVAKVGKFLRITKQISKVNPLLLNLDKVSLGRRPFVTIQVAVYNEKNVIERLITACTSQKWSDYELIIVDDSNDETTEIAKKLLSNGGRKTEFVRKDKEMEYFISKVRGGPTVKYLHRFSRSGYKGAALGEALKLTDKRSEYICVFDSDFVPYPDTIEQFVKSFQESCGSLDEVKKSNIAAVQGYQWHVLNKSENWVTRGVRTEYAGSYVIERAGIGVYGGLNMIAGSVFCIRRDVLDKFHWGTSITEDFQLTLRLYEGGYKVLFTPYIQAPAEAVSTVRRLIRQRMRWAEGHTFNVKLMWKRLLSSSEMSTREKFEFIYLAPYYLQAAFFLIGTFAWFIAEVVIKVNLPFWTSAWGWSLIFTNFLALPLMNLVGLFLEESEERDYLGITSFLLLSYLLVPFQAYAAVKALFEKNEGPWFRTPKTGSVTDVFSRVKIYSWFDKFKFLPGKKAPVPATSSSFEMPAFASAFNPLSGYKIKPKRVPAFARVIVVVLISVTLLLNYLAFYTQPVEANDSNNHLEQQVELTSQNYSLTSASYVPTDNSLGLWKYESAAFDPAPTAAFEAILKGDPDDVGQYAAVDCVASNECFIVYYDANDGDLEYANCYDGGDTGNQPCNTASEISLTTLDSTGDVGQWASIDCGLVSTTRHCRIAYYDATNTALKFISCTADGAGASNDACDTAGERTTRVLDGATGCVITSCSTSADVGQYTDISCVSNANCKIVADGSAGDMTFYDCDDATCSTGSQNDPSTSIEEGKYAIYCPSTDDCRASGIQSNSKIAYVDCSDETCSSSTVELLTETASISTIGEYTDIDCPHINYCRVAYYRSYSLDPYVLVCDNDAACGSGNRSLNSIETTNNIGKYIQLDCSSTTVCKFVYYDESNTALRWANCTTAICDSVTYNHIDGSTCGLTNCNSAGSIGKFAGVMCYATNTCTIVSYDAATYSLRVGTCSNANCSAGEASTVESSGNATITAGLYTSAGSIVNCGSDVEVSSDDAIGDRIRFSACTPSLVDGTQYTVRAKTDTGNTAYLMSARLILTQNPGTGNIEKTQTSVMLGGTGSTAATVYLDPDSTRYCFDSDSTGSACSAASPTLWDPAPTVRFESTMAANSSTDEASLELYNGSGQVALAEGIGSTWTRLRDESVTLAAGTEYYIRHKCADGGDGDSVCLSQWTAPRLIFEQTDASSGITALEIVHQYNARSVTESSTSYVTYPFDNQLSKDNYQGTATYFFESNFQSNTSCGGSKQPSCTFLYAQLYDVTASSVISNVTVLSATTIARIRSTDITSSMPGAGTTNELTVQIKTLSQSQPIVDDNSWTIIQISGLQVPEVALFALPGALFLPKIVKWWKNRQERRRREKVRASSR